MNRRVFLKKSSQLAIASNSIVLLNSVCGKQENAKLSMPIIDTHQHLWDLNKFTLSWLKPPLDRSFTIRDYLEASDGLNVVKAVYMQVGVAAEQILQEVEYVIELCKNPDVPTCAAVISGRLADEGFEKYIMRFKGNPYVKGIRNGFRTAEQMSSQRIIKNLRLLGDLGMSFDLIVPPKVLIDGAQLVGQCPDTRFILDHCGNADPVAFFSSNKERPRMKHHTADEWKHGIDQLAKKKNIICKISGLIDNVMGYPISAEDLAPIINHCLDAFGPDRVIFASDWPVCRRGATLREWVTMLKEIVSERPEKDQRKLFHDNAMEFYGLG